MDEDTIKLGMELGFNVHETDIVQKLLQVIKNLDGQIQTSTKSAASLNGEFGKLQKAIVSLNIDTNAKVVTNQYRDMAGYVTKVQQSLDKTNAVYQTIQTTINNVAQREKDELKNQENLNKALEQSVRLRQRESDLAYKTSLQVAKTEEKSLRINNTASGKTASNTYMAQLMAGGWTGGAEVSSILNAKNGDLITLQTNNLKKYFETIGKGVTVTQDIGNATDGWVKSTVSLRQGSNDARKVQLMWNQELQKGVVVQNEHTSGILDHKKALTSWGEAIKTAWERSIQWLVSMTALYGTLHMLRDAYKTMIDVENEATNIFKVLPQKTAQDQLNQLLPAAISLAKEYGQSVTDVEKSMGVWARQTKNTNDIITLTRASILASTATDISYEESVKDISAITSEWKMNAIQAYHVVDVLNEHSNNYRVTAQGLAEALAKTGSGARAAGMSFEQLSGILTTSIQSLGLEGGEAGTFISRVMARMIGNKKAKEALEKIGIDTMQPLSKIMDQLMVKWDGLSSAAKRNFAVVVAGTNHWNKFVGLLDNGATIIQATADAYLSAGSAQREVTTMMGTTQKQIAQLNASWQEFIVRNESFLNIVKFLVNVLNSVVSGMNKANTATLAFFATLTALSALVGLLTGHWEIFIGSLAIAGVTFGLMGKGAMTATQRINELKVAQEQYAQSVEGGANTAQGIKYLTDQYNSLRAAIKKAKESGENYHGLQVKLNVVEDKLIQIVSRETGLREDQLRKYKDLNTASKQALQNVLDEVNGNRRLEALKRAEIVSTQGAKLTAHLTTLEMLDDEYKAFMHYEKLKQGAIDNPKEAFKMGWERGGGWKSPTTGLVSAVLSAMSGGKLSFDNPIMKQLYKSNNGFVKWFGETSYSRFEDQPFMKEVFGRRSGLHVNWEDIKRLVPNLTMEELFGYNKSDGGENGSDIDFGDKKEKKISSFYTDLKREQIEWINTLAATLDKAHGLEQETYQVMFKDGGNDFTLMASSETKSMLENLIKEWESYGNEVKSVIKSVSDSILEANLGMAESASNAAKEWDDIVGKMKNIPDVLKDTLGIGDFYSKRQKEYSDIYNNLNQQKTSLANKINETQQKINENNSIYYNRDTKQADREIAAANVENYKKTLSELVAQLPGLINQMMTVAGGASFYGQQGQQWQQIMSINADAVQSAYNNVLNSQNAYANAEQKSQANGQVFKGSATEWLLSQNQYNAWLGFVQSIQGMINSTQDARKIAEAAGMSTKDYDVQLQKLNTDLQNATKNLGQRPAMPQDELASIQNKYKPVSDEFKKTMEEYGYTFDDLGINTRKEIHNLQSALSDYIGFLGRSDQMIAAINAALKDPQLDRSTRESYERLLDYWNKAKNGAIDALATVDSDIQQAKDDAERMHLADTVGDTFKAFLKGTKNLKQAFLDMLNEMKNNNIDKFVDNWMNKLTESMKLNDSKDLTGVIKNMWQSFSQAWKEASTNQKIQLGLGAASLLVQNDNSKQSYEAQGALSGASAGSAFGLPGTIIGGILGLFSGKKKYQQEQRKKARDLQASIMDSMYADSYQSLSGFYEAGEHGLDVSSIEEVIKKWQDLFSNGGIADLINSTNVALLQTYEKWAKFLDSLNASVSNITSNLENAFAADNYVAFLQTWGTSLESMTRTALIRGFLAQGPLQAAYQNLSNTIGLSVLDGILTAEEIAAIKGQGDAIASQMKLLYESLALVDNMFPDTNSDNGSNQSYTAGSSTPIVYNNYITIQSQAFMGDKDDAREFALMLEEIIVENQSRG